MASDFEKFSICRYHNNHQTAVTLMIDDLAPTAITRDGRLLPYRDHGYGMHHKDGLYHYFEKHLLEPFPELRGTFFILIDQHTNHASHSGGYKILSDGFSDDYVRFLKSTAPQFDLAYHGTNHGKNESGKFHQEFSYLTLKDIPRLKTALVLFEEKTGIKFNGGKYPGYVSNEYSQKILEEIGMKWWACSHGMKNKRTSANDFHYFGDAQKVLNFPTTFSGEAFKTFLKPKMESFPKLRTAYQFYRKFKLENHLQYLYENQYVISIQEHFTTLRADGKFQRPNVFDDLMSIRQTYSILRGADIWHASCNEIARYIENRDFGKLEQNENRITLSYNGRYSDFSISLQSKERNTLADNNGNTIKPFSKGGLWIYPNLTEGEYTIG